MPEHRHIYKIRSRNLRLGAFDSESQGFIGVREKFGSYYLDTEYVWHNVREYELPHLAIVPDEIPMTEGLPSICNVCAQRCDFRETSNLEISGGWHHVVPDPTHKIFPTRPMNMALFELMKRLEMETF